MTNTAFELTRLLYMAAGEVDGNEERSHITGLEHSLRVATLAKKDYALRKSINSPRAHEENIIMALVHDLAKPLSEEYHGEVIAEIVRHRVCRICYNVLRTHGQYQDAYFKKSIADKSVSWALEAYDLQAWEIESFSPTWNIQTMTLDEALNLIENYFG